MKKYSASKKIYIFISVFFLLKKKKALEQNTVEGEREMSTHENNLRNISGKTTT